MRTVRLSPVSALSSTRSVAVFRDRIRQSAGTLSPTWSYATHEIGKEYANNVSRDELLGREIGIYYSIANTTGFLGLHFL